MDNYQNDVKSIVHMVNKFKFHFLSCSCLKLSEKSVLLIFIYWLRILSLKRALYCFIFSMEVRLNVIGDSVTFTYRYFYVSCVLNEYLTKI